MFQVKKNGSNNITANQKTQRFGILKASAEVKLMCD